MLLNLSDVELDLSNSFEVDFADWYTNERGQTKELLLCGYFCTRYGVMQYLRSTIATDSSDLIHTLQKETEEKENKLIELTKRMNDMIQQQVQMQTAFYQSANQSLENNLTSQRGMYESQIRDLKDQLQNIEAMVTMQLKKEIEERDTRLITMSEQMSDIINQKVHMQIAFYQEANKTLESNLSNQRTMYESKINELQNTMKLSEGLITSQLTERFAREKECMQSMFSSLEASIEKQKQYDAVQWNEEKQNYERCIQGLREEITNIKQHVSIEFQEKHVKDVELERYRLQTQFKEEMNKILVESEKFKTLYYEEITKGRELVTNIHTNAAQHELQVLKDQHQKALQEIAILKKMNSAKGNKGEHIIASALRSIYPNTLVDDTSKLSHAGDIRMTFPDGTFVIIESKYKESGVARTDIVKFQRDVEELSKKEGENFHGAVLVSMCSKNIPTKGDMQFEMWAGKPVLYLGYSDEEEFGKWFGHTMNLFTSTAKCQAFYLRQNNVFQELLEKITPFFEKMRKLKTSVGRVKASIIEMEETVVELSKDADVIIDTYITAGPCNGGAPRGGGAKRSAASTSKPASKKKKGEKQ